MPAFQTREKPGTEIEEPAQSQLMMKQDLNEALRPQSSCSDPQHEPS